MSPRVLAKIVRAGTKAISFGEGSENLANLADLSISPERVRRACRRVGEDRIDHHRRLQEAFQDKPLPERIGGKPDDVEAPQIACVMADGGRFQQLDRTEPVQEKSARKGDHWKESRIGLLVSMSGERHEVDPQPELPPELRYQGIAETLSEIGKTGAKLDSPEEETEFESIPSDGLGGPSVEDRKVVASGLNWANFGPLLASQAWYLGFAVAPRKVFVSDGSLTIEKMQRKHFSHYTSVLDILHGLSYSLAAARAVSKDEKSAEQKYDDWAAKIWKGQVEDVVDELLVYAAKYGEPPPDPSSDDPREVIRVARVFYENHVRRMNYPHYRREGFPLTSSLVESTVKQVGRRVKGSEKFWSSSGGEAMLRLRGEYLSESPMQGYWEERSQNASGVRTHRRKPQVVNK